MRRKNSRDVAMRPSADSRILMLFYSWKAFSWSKIISYTQFLGPVILHCDSFFLNPCNTQGHFMLTQFNCFNSIYVLHWKAKAFSHFCGEATEGRRQNSWSALTHSWVLRRQAATASGGGTALSLVMTYCPRRWSKSCRKSCDTAPLAAVSSKLWVPAQSLRISGSFAAKLCGGLRSPPFLTSYSEFRWRFSCKMLYTIRKAMIYCRKICFTYFPFFSFLGH